MVETQGVLPAGAVDVGHWFAHLGYRKGQFATLMSEAKLTGGELCLAISDALGKASLGLNAARQTMRDADRQGNVEASNEAFNNAVGVVSQLLETLEHIRSEGLPYLPQSLQTALQHWFSGVEHSYGWIPTASIEG